MWKILLLPHSLKDQVLHLITLLSYSFQPLIGPFFGIRRGGLGIGCSDFTALVQSPGFLFLKTVTSEVSEFLTVETLYSPHVRVFPLPSEVSLLWGKGRSWVIVIDFGTIGVPYFSYVGSSSVCLRVHGVGVHPLMKGWPGIV